MHAVNLLAPLIAIVAGVITTVALLAGLIWRLSAYHSRIEHRLGQLERSVSHIERVLGIRARNGHRRRR